MAERKFFGRLFGQKLRNSVADAEGGVSLNREVWRRFKRNKMAMTSLVVIILFAIIEHSIVTLVVKVILVTVKTVIVLVFSFLPGPDFIICVID